VITSSISRPIRSDLSLSFSEMLTKIGCRYMYLYFYTDVFIEISVCILFMRVAPCFENKS
jgi:hypothetical protein